MKFKYAFIALTVLTIFIAACSPVEEEPQDVLPPINDQDDIIAPPEGDVWISNSNLNYVINVEKPTPCHELDVNEQLLGSFPLDIRVEIDLIPPMEGEICAEVITPETVEETLPIGEQEVGRFALYYDGSLVITTTSVETR